MPLDLVFTVGVLDSVQQALKRLLDAFEVLPDGGLQLAFKVLGLSDGVDQLFGLDCFCG